MRELLRLPEFRLLVYLMVVLVLLEVSAQVASLLFPELADSGGANLIYVYLLTPSVFAVCVLVATHLFMEAPKSRSWRSMMLASSGRVRLDAGLGVGLLEAVLLMGLLLLSGAYRWAGPGRLLLEPSRRAVFEGALAVGGLLLAALGEEVVFRGMVLRLIQKRWNTGLAVVGSSLVFGMLHVTNPNASLLLALNAALAGVLLAFLALRWGVIASVGLHAAWNVLLAVGASMPISGVATGGLLAFSDRGPGWWTGGLAGGEGGLAATLVLSAGAWFGWWLWQRRHEAPRVAGA